MLPPTTSATESVWPPCLHKGVDLVPVSKQSDPPSQRQPKAASSRTAATIEEKLSFFFWNRARTLAPPNHLILAGMCIPLFSASRSSWSLTRPTSLFFPMYRVSEMLWIRIHFHFCWGTTSVMLLSATRAALSAMSRRLSRSCKAGVGVVTPRIRRVSVHRILSILTLLMPYGGPD